MNIVICVDETSAGSFGDAAWGVKRFRELGHRIIITGRTDGAYADACKITAGEEPENTGKMDSVLIGDRISDCAGAAARGIPAIVFNSKDNREEETELLRADNWAEAVKAVQQIQRGYLDRGNAEKLLTAAEAINFGPWGDHCRVAARCAEKIAAACEGMDPEKAYVCGLLHDIGRRFLVRDLGHIYYGWQYMQRLGYPQVARICLSHSFPNQDFRIFIGKIDIPAHEADAVRGPLNGMKFDDYDRLIQLCDALAGSGGVLDMEERMADVKRRYGNYPQAQWDKNMELKHYFEEKAGKNIYDIVA